MWGVDQKESASRALRVKIANILDEHAHGFSESVLRGQGLDFVAIRPFRMGDSAKSVDWMASSRSDDESTLVVREFSPERKPSVIVVADLHQAMEHPKAKALYAHALLEMYARSSFALGGSSRIIGISSGGLIASPELTSNDDVLLFMQQCDVPGKIRQFRQPFSSLKIMFAEWKPKNTLIVFISDLRTLDVLSLNCMSVVDRVRQNVEYTYVVLDEWSGFMPSSHIVLLRNAEDGSVAHVDLREGGEFHQESIKFSERVLQLRSLGRRQGMSVHTLPLTHERPLSAFMRSWHKREESRS